MFKLSLLRYFRSPILVKKKLRFSSFINLNLRSSLFKYFIDFSDNPRISKFLSHRSTSPKFMKSDFIKSKYLKDFVRFSNPKLQLFFMERLSFSSCNNFNSPKELAKFDIPSSLTKFSVISKDRKLNDLLSFIINDNLER